MINEDRVKFLWRIDIHTSESYNDYMLDGDIDIPR